MYEFILHQIISLLVANIKALKMICLRLAENLLEGTCCNNIFINSQLFIKQVSKAMKNISSYKILNFLFEYFKLNRILYWFNK